MKSVPFIILASLLSLLIAALGSTLTAAWGAPVDIRLGNATVSREVKSLRDLKYANIVRQTKDFSCGAASLATILSHYFGMPTSEEEILEALFRKADRATIKRVREQGISLLDLKLYAESRGLVGKGLRMEPAQLDTLDRPAIVLINLHGYSHFVVIRGVEGGKVYLADPARGHWFRTLEEFGQLWNGILLAFMRGDGERVSAHDLEIKPFWSRGLTELLPADLLSLQFVRGADEF